MARARHRVDPDRSTPLQQSARSRSAARRRRSRLHAGGRQAGSDGDDGLEIRIQAPPPEHRRRLPGSSRRALADHQRSPRHLSGRRAREVAHDGFRSVQGDASRRPALRTRHVRHARQSRGDAARGAGTGRGWRALRWHADLLLHGRRGAQRHRRLDLHASADRPDRRLRDHRRTDRLGRRSRRLGHESLDRQFGSLPDRDHRQGREVAHLAARHQRECDHGGGEAPAPSRSDDVHAHAG